jgi:hypothetical protein
MAHFTADSLLTNLCAICHTAAPKYKCPRCSKRTCSLSCVRKHKMRSQCDGVRDATAYKHKALTTRAGVDHDYNFLSDIERKKRAAEHALVHTHGIISERELRPIEVQHVEWRKPRAGGKSRKVLVTRHLRRDREDEDDKVMGRCKRLGITVVRAPVGMSIRREKGLRYSYRHKKVQFPIRWLLVSPEFPCGEELWTVSLDSMRIGVAFLHSGGKKTAGFAASGTGDKRGLHGAEDAARFTFQDPATTAWIPTQAVCHQAHRLRHDVQCSTWRVTDGIGSRPALPSRDEWTSWLGDRVQFYLSQRPPNSISAGDSVIAVDAADQLKDALSGTVVFEHPTIYVVRKLAALPTGCKVLHRAATGLGVKRRRPNGDDNGRQRSPKKIRHDVLEEGEVQSEDDMNADVGCEDESDSGSDIVAEVELGDDDSDSGSGDDTNMEESLAEAGFDIGTIVQT